MAAIHHTPLRYALAGASGLLGAAAFPEYGWWPLILVAPAALMVALRGAGLRHGLYLGLGQGVVFYGCGLSWLTRIFGSGALALWLLLAAYGMLGGGLIGWASARHARWPWLAAFAALVASALEFVRCEVNWLAFPWLSYGLGLGPTWLSPWIGVYGAGFLVVLAGALVVFGGRRQRLGGGALMLALGLLGCLRPGPVAPDDAGVPVLAVQSEHCDFYRYLELTEAQSFADGIILWPEYATVFELPTDAKANALAMGLVQHRHATLILGTQEAAGDDAHYNRALTLEASGPVGSHHKNHPVPFMNDGLPGTATVPAATRFGRIGTPICFDCDYTDTVRRFTVAGAEAFAVPSMDASGWSAKQHLQHAELFRQRALENGRWIVVCATSGLTQLIDSHGNRRDELPLLRDGVMESRLHLCSDLTFFTRIGWIFPWVVCGLAVVAVIAAAWQSLAPAVLTPQRADAKFGMSTAELKQFMEATAIFQRETARIVKETSLSMKDTDRRMKETDIQMKENAIQMKETDRKLKELGKQLGGLGNKFGAFAEGLAFSSIARILRANFGMEAITPRFAVEKGGESEEYDVLAYSNGGTNKGMIVEVKSSLDLATVKQMKRKMDRLFHWMPEHRNKEFQGMVAYVEGSAAARQAVLAQGWHLVHVDEDLFELKNPPGFVPKIYRAEVA